MQELFLAFAIYISLTTEDKEMQTTTPPGQSFAKRWAIYAALGAPTLDLKTWHLSTRGLVEKPVTLSFEEMEKWPQVKLTRDFHCVTTWSIKDVVWEGISFRELAKLTSVKKEAQWVMFHCADGYTAPVPLEDAMVEDSLIALKMNGKPIPVQQGFPSETIYSSLIWLEERQMAYRRRVSSQVRRRVLGDVWIS